MIRRRAFLATGAATMASLSGCIFGRGSSRGSSGAEELLSEDTERIVKTGEGIEARLRSITHSPSEGRAKISAEIKVPREDRYRVRLGIIDNRDVVLAADISEPTLYGTGWDLVPAELTVDDCGACYSGLVEVSFSNQSETIQAEEKEQREAEAEQEQEARDAERNETAAANESENESANETEGDQ